jgi:hypothetical protein
MPFRAIVDGVDTLSLDLTREDWRQLAIRVKRGASSISMECCGHPGIMKLSPLGHQFFAHKGDRPHGCNWKPESPEHVDLKAAVFHAINSVDGWRAKIEANRPDWRADVLATRGETRIAFEVQLSAQSGPETAFREDRYRESGILPWWIVKPGRNAGEAFGSELRTVLDVRKNHPVEGAAIAARRVLMLAESQVAIAEAVIAFMHKHDIGHRVHRHYGLPVVIDGVAARREAPRMQPIVIGELGDDAVPGLEELRQRAPGYPLGTVIQFVRHGSPIQDFGAPAFIVRNSPDVDIQRELDRIQTGRLVWRGTEHHNKIEAALIWYRETCRKCAEDYAMAPFIIAGHLRHHEDYAPIVRRWWSDVPAGVVEAFEKREGLRLSLPTAALTHLCPHCRAPQPPSLISEADAIERWPHRTIDWTIRVPIKQGSWTKPVVPAQRDRPPVSEWEVMLAAKSQDRDDREWADPNSPAPCARRTPSPTAKQEPPAPTWPPEALLQVRPADPGTLPADAPGGDHFDVWYRPTSGRQIERCHYLDGAEGGVFTDGDGRQLDAPEAFAVHVWEMVRHLDGFARVA